MVTAEWLLAIAGWLLAIARWLLAIFGWLLAIAGWLLAIAGLGAGHLVFWAAGEVLHVEGVKANSLCLHTKHLL